MSESKSTMNLSSKISKLLISKKFSDVKFCFQNAKTSETVEIYAHKLVLALTSDVFAKMFYDSNSDKLLVEKEIIKISTPPKAFRIMLEYIYTDNLNIESIEDACQLNVLGAKYGLKELEEKSLEIINRSMTIGNFFQLLETSINENFWLLRRKCLNFLMENSKKILTSNLFLHASESVVEEIVRQDDLQVDSELDVLKAVINWGMEKSKNKGNIAKDFLRNDIDPFIKYIRFLTLSPGEFMDFTEQFDILTSEETNKITMKLLDSNYTEFPKTISRNERKRNSALEPLKSSDSIATPLFNNDYMEYSKTDNCDPPLDLQFDLLSHGVKMQNYPINANRMDPYFQSNVMQNTYTTQMQQYSYNVNKPINQHHIQEKNSAIQDLLSDPTECYRYGTASRSSKIAQVKPISNSSRDILAPPRVSPLSFYPNHSERKNLMGQPVQLTYDIPLSDTEATLETSRETDITSTLDILVDGEVTIYGFVLKIVEEGNSEQEKIRVIVDVTQNSKDIPQKAYDSLLRNGLLNVKLENPVRLSNEAAKFELVIEGIKRQRCYKCVKPNLEIHGNASLEFMLKSNQKVGGGFLYLISRIIYSA